MKDIFSSDVIGFMATYRVPLLIAAGVIILLRLVISIIITSQTKKKGYSEIPIFIMCFLLGIYGYVIAAALVDKRVASPKNSKQLPRQGQSLIPDSTDTRTPNGAVAYMPADNGSNDMQSQAVENIKKYWQENNQEV